MKFYWRRIVRVVLPYLLLGGFFWVIKDFVINKQMNQFIQDYFLISFWKKGTRVMWYVALILLLYALSPIIYSIVKKLNEKSWILPAIVILVSICISYLFPAWFNDCEIALLRIPIYMFGFIYSERIMKAEAVKRSDIILLMMFIPIDILCYYTNSRFTRLGHGLFIIFLILFLASFYSPLGKKGKGEKMLAWFGTMSYELYLVHVLGRNICNSLHIGLENLLYYIIFIMICVPISKLLSHVFHAIQLRITA